MVQLMKRGRLVTVTRGFLTRENMLRRVAGASSRQAAARGGRALSTAKKIAGEPGRVVVVTSGKGGVGKTTVTASLGFGLASRGFRTCLIDFDIGLRNLDLHLVRLCDDRRECCSSRNEY